MADHELTCPACGSKLFARVMPHVGGSVQEEIALSVAATEAKAASVLEAAKAAVEKAQADAVAAAKEVLAAAGGKK